MIEDRPYQEPRAKNQEPRIKNQLHINKPVQKTTNLFARSAILGSRLSVLLRRARWFRPFLFLGAVVLLALAGGWLGHGFGAGMPSILSAQTAEPIVTAPTTAAQPTPVGAAPIAAPAAQPTALAGRPSVVTTAPTPAAQPTPLAPVDGHTWPIAQQETFEQVSANWPEILGPSWWSRYRDGGYDMVLSGRPSISYSSPLPSHDFWFGADVQVLSGRAGLFFLLDRPNDFYRLLIDAEGHYRLEWQQVGYSRPLIDWSASDALRHGQHAINRIAAQRQGDTLVLYANGIVLNTYTLPPGNTLAGRIGLALDAPDGQHSAEAWFDNLEVRAPASP